MDDLIRLDEEDAGWRPEKPGTKTQDLEAGAPWWTMAITASTRSSERGYHGLPFLVRAAEAAPLPDPGGAFLVADPAIAPSQWEVLVLRMAKKGAG